MRPSPQVGTRRFTILYLSALAAVALLSVGGQVIVHSAIEQQVADSSLINVAGRQRMLSQRITKSALLLNPAERDEQGAGYDAELKTLLQEWMRGHEYLVARENTVETEALLDVAEPLLSRMFALAEAVLTSGGADENSLTALLGAEPQFLALMEQIVGRYEEEAAGRVARLRRIEYWLFTVTLAVLALEAAFVFRPAVARIRQSLERLQDSEAERALAHEELSTIFDSVPAMILHHDAEGRIVRANRMASEMMGESVYKLEGASVYRYFKDQEEQVREEDRLTLTTAKAQRGLLHYMRGTDGEVRWLRMNKMPYRDERYKVAGIIVFAVDVTEHKKLERSFMELRAEADRRLGYDLHDGIGQELSGILYLSKRMRDQLVARGADEAEMAGEIRDLVKQSVENVRNLSHSLCPLKDEPEALSRGLEELAKATAALGGLRCTFVEEGRVLLFEQDVAEHLYRIAQEAVNNAVRHSGATSIEIKLKQTDERTLLEVRDDGNGNAVVMLKLKRDGRSGSGMGLSIMEHRAELVGGRFRIEKNEAGGSTVRCTVES